jgi:hypothetical protein
MFLVSPPTKVSSASSSVSGPTHFLDGSERSGTQSHAEPLKHKPCRLLGDAEGAVNLHAADTILAINQHPKRCHPLIHAERRILKNRIDLERELLVASTTEPQLARLDEVALLGTATRANDLAIGPAQFDGVLESAARIGEVNDGLL